MPFLVTIYPEDDFDNDGETGLPLCGFVTTRPLAKVRVLAANGRKAAAKGYLRVLGRPRLRMLIELRAPGPCIRAEMRDHVDRTQPVEVPVADWSAIRWFKRTAGAFGGFDSCMRTWYLCVERLTLPRRVLHRLLRRRARRCGLRYRRARSAGVG